MEYPAWEIKCIGVNVEQGKYYMPSLNDVYYRRILDHIFLGRIKMIAAINLFARISYIWFKSICLRNDNGSPFVANNGSRAAY
jgi:hypothetical protein